MNELNVISTPILSKLRMNLGHRLSNSTLHSQTKIHEIISKGSSVYIDIRWLGVI